MGVLFLHTVAPLVGAWIEIVVEGSVTRAIRVAPLVGAWIEITYGLTNTTTNRKSLPLWERGLKCLLICSVAIRIYVAPLVGAWIEIKKIIAKTYISPGRSPCGSVD